MTVRYFKICPGSRRRTTHENSGFNLYVLRNIEFDNGDPHETLRKDPGPDRPDCWIAGLQSPFTIVLNNFDLTVTHLVLAARWEDTSIGIGATHLPLGIAYVTDLSLLNDPELDFAKCHYVAVGVGSVTTADDPAQPLREVIAGTR